MENGKWKTNNFDTPIRKMAEKTINFTVMVPNSTNAHKQIKKCECVCVI